MESLERLSAVIDLGKRLVAQLKLGEDETAQWMAHTLAERIKLAEDSPSEERNTAQKSCAELVFQIWERRYSLPSRLRPFKELEPILRTLNSLDISNGPRFRFMQEPPAEVESDNDSKQLLELAAALDSTARILVQSLIASAAEHASKEAQPWIQSAAEAGADVMLETRIVSFVNAGLNDVADEADVHRQALKKNIEKLEFFASIAATHAAELRTKHGLQANEEKETELH